MLSHPDQTHSFSTSNTKKEKTASYFRRQRTKHIGSLNSFCSVMILKSYDINLGITSVNSAGLSHREVWEERKLVILNLLIYDISSFCALWDFGWNLVFKIFLKYYFCLGWRVISTILKFIFTYFYLWPTLCENFANMISKNVYCTQ